MNLHLDILRVLKNTQGHLLPEPSLLDEVRQTCVPPPPVSEFSQALKFLEVRVLITSVRPELGGPLKWHITDAGRVELANHP